jgi:hypothetical protein
MGVGSFGRVGAGATRMLRKVAGLVVIDRTLVRPLPWSTSYRLDIWKRRRFSFSHVRGCDNVTSSPP